jgi:hypothetical protein
MPGGAALLRATAISRMKSFVALVLCATVSSACISRRVDVEPVSTRAPVLVTSAVKAHLKDGATVVYPDGVRVTGDALEGKGTRYDVTLKTATIVESVPLADVIGMETFRTRVNAVQTTLLSAATAFGVYAGALALAIALFGSCPTVYSAGGAVEEAELFSNSIAPLFEGRDLDRLQATADAQGNVVLEVRNEAMETHYINHLELLEVSHGPDERVVPDQHGTAIVIGKLRKPRTAVTRAGKDVRNLFAAPDGRFYAADANTLTRVTDTDMEDSI